MPTSTSSHRTVFLLYPGVAALDVAGPAQAFAAAGHDRYALDLVSLAGGSIPTDCRGVALHTRRARHLRGRIDTLVLPGGDGFKEATANTRFMATVERLAARAERIACVCVGSFLAAEAGLLSNKRTTTHWRASAELTRRYPDVRVEADHLWVRDRNIWSSAGVSAGIDLALALIEHDHGPTTAISVAKDLVVYQKRPGGQSQFSRLLSWQIAAAGGRLEPVLSWMAEHIAEDLRLERVARHVGMSPRTLARVFTKNLGLTPAKAVEQMRVETARSLLEQTDLSLSEVAAKCGFGDEQRMRRAFRRQLRVTPSETRARFGIGG